MNAKLRPVTRIGVSYPQNWVQLGPKTLPNTPLVRALTLANKSDKIQTVSFTNKTRLLRK